MRMYTVIFEQDGETIATFTTHAVDEEGARSQCDAFFQAFSRDHPDDAPPQGDGVSIRVEPTTWPGQKVTWSRNPLGTTKGFRCPCCKFKTLYGRGQDEICPVCFWHDDGQDEADAERVLGGPNRGLSLRQAQVNFRRIGAIDERFLAHVRSPSPDEI